MAICIIVNYQRRVHIWIRQADKNACISRKHKTNFVGLEIVTILGKRLFVDDSV